MILIHIVPENNAQSDEIVDILVEKKLILNAMIHENIRVRQKSKAGAIESITRNLIVGKTKALLFNIIDELLREKYGNHMPVLYSIPIVHMDWEQAEELIEETEKV